MMSLPVIGQLEFSVNEQVFELYIFSLSSFALIKIILVYKGVTQYYLKSRLKNANVYLSFCHCPYFYSAPMFLDCYVSP